MLEVHASIISSDDGLVSCEFTQRSRLFGAGSGPAGAEVIGASCAIITAANPAARIPGPRMASALVRRQSGIKLDERRSTVESAGIAYAFAWNAAPRCALTPSARESRKERSCEFC